MPVDDWVNRGHRKIDRHGQGRNYADLSYPLRIESGSSLLRAPGGSEGIKENCGTVKVKITREYELDFETISSAIKRLYGQFCGLSISR